MEENKSIITFHQSNQLSKVANSLKITNKLLAKDDEKLIPYRKGKKWGFCTPDKKIEIDCEFDIVFRFNNGLARVQRNKKWGFIDLKGNIKIDIVYDYAQSFREGLAAVSKSGNWSFIDVNGNVIFSDSEYINDFYEGLAPVGKSLICYIDSNGNSIIKDSLKELAPVGGYIEIRHIYGFIDRNGSFIIPCIYENNHHGGKETWNQETEGEIEFTESGFIFSEGFVRLEKNNKYGFFDRNGKMIVPFIYDKAYNFSNGLAEVGLIKPGTFDNITGYVDKTGAIVIPLKYKFIQEGISQFSEELALVEPINGYGNEFFINKNDEIIIPHSNSCKFMRCFSEGLALVRNRDSKFGFINKQGKIAIECVYDRADGFSDGLCLVNLKNKSLFINKFGEKVIDCKQSIIYNKFYNGLAFCRIHHDGNIYTYSSSTVSGGYIDKNGVEFWED